MHYCTNCGQADADIAGLCQRCASTMAQRCSACSQPLPPSNRFCGFCGAPAGDVPLAPALSAPLTISQAQPGTLLHGRREVTVLFLDVTNFTAASHGLDSEDVYDWINETMRLLADVVRKYEGAIDKFTGDGLMALFGVPDAHENDPERAVRAALEMQQIVQPLRERIKLKHGFDFQMRIGVNTGMVVAGNVGGQIHAEYTVLGDTVNLASRLEKAAEPGSTLVSEITYQHTRQLIEYTILPPITVKGVAEPIPIYRPVRLLDQPGSVRGIPGLRAPMIGRAHVLAQLQGALDNVQRLGSARLALISGEAGFGKSRLIAEFRAGLASSGIRCYQGGCLAYARSTPLWVIADLLRDLLHLSQIDPADIQRETLRAHLAQIGLATPDTLIYLSNVLGIGQIDADTEARLRLMDASMLQRQTHATLRHVLLAEAQREPTILIFEDLHWIDSASRDFLEYLIKTIGDVPLLLLMVSRASERATVIRPLVEAAEAYGERFTDIQIQVLSDAESELLVDQLIQHESAEARAIKRQIVARGGGIPFYVEEIVRLLIDQGGLTQERSGWQVTAHADALLHEVPSTLKGLILTRFDRTDGVLRRLLQKAAVLGRSFPANLLQLLGGDSSTAIAAHVAELVERQFLVAEPFGWAQGFAFRHVLIQEAIYGTLLKRDRQKIHEQVAQLVERAAFWPHDEQIEVLAYHYAESSRPARAVPYLLDAAENAARRYANETAIRHYRQAIALISADAPEQVDDFFRACSGLGQALKFVGQFGEASQVLEDALARLYARNQGQVQLSRYVSILRELADVRQRERCYDDATSHLESALGVLDTDGAQTNPALWRSVMDRLAWIRFQQGNLDESQQLASTAIGGVQLEYADDPITLASLCNTLGGVSWQHGDLAGATRYVERSLQLYKGLGYAWGTAIAYTNLGVLYYAMGVWNRAAESFEQAYLLRRENGYLPEQALNLHNLGMLYLEMGDHSRAESCLAESRVISERLGDGFGVVCAEIGLLRLAVVRSDAGTASEYARRVSALLVDSKGEEAIQLRAFQALIHGMRGEIEPGVRLAEEAVSMAREAVQSEQEPECVRVLGLLRGLAGEVEQAEKLLQESVDGSRRRNDIYRQALALLDLGRLHERSKDASGQQQALAEYEAAVEYFARLGATYDLQAAIVARDLLRRRMDARTTRGLPAQRHIFAFDQHVDMERPMIPK